MNRFWPFRRSEHEPSERVEKVRVDFNLDDRPQSVCALLTRLQPLLAQDVVKWRLDLSDCGYLGPHAGAMIVASLLHTRKQNRIAQVTLPQGSAQLKAFCEFSGLRHYVSGTPFPDRSHPRNVTIAMRSILQSTFNDPDPIIELIRSHTVLSNETEEYLRICINEVIQNVEDHSESNIGAVTSARYMQNSKEVKVAIVDRGVGIGTTLRRRHPEVADARDALQRVLEGGYSAKSRPNNMGVGLSNLCSIVVKQLRGELFILSEDGFADGKPSRNPVSKSLADAFPGTAVFFNVPVDR